MGRLGGENFGSVFYTVVVVVVVVVSSPYLTKLAYVDVGSSRVHDSPRVIQPFLNYVVIHVPDRRLT